jgi:MFS family permease
MIPSILFSVISGVYVDRWNKKKVLLITHLLRGTLLLPFLIPNLHLSLIYVFTFLIAVVTQFFTPAESSIIPKLVPRNMIVPANAVFSSSIFGIMLTGYILSGPALLLLGRTNTIILLISLYFLSAFIVTRIKAGIEKEKSFKDDVVAPTFSVAHEAKEIFVFIKKAKRVMHALLMITIAQAVILMFAVLAPGYVTTILEAPLESLSVILIAPAVLGLGIGAFIIGSMKNKIKHELISAMGFMVVGIVFIFMPLSGKIASYGFVHNLNDILPYIVHVNVLHLIVVMSVITGLGISLIFIPSNSTIQIETSEELRGRMYGLLSSLIGAVSFIPVVLAGGLGDLFGVGAVIAGVGVLMILFSFYYLFIAKKI